MYKTAVYLFPGSQTGSSLALYSAYYGDIASIAERFFKMRVRLNEEDYATAFLKANREVDFVPKISIQTDYRTVLKANGTLSVWSYDKTEPHSIFEGAWYAFVNQYGVQEPLYPFQMEAGTTKFKIMTVSEIQQWLRYLREFSEDPRETVERSQKAFFLELQLRRIQEKK